MKIKKREACILTHKKDLEVLHTFKKFPVFMGCIDQDESLDLLQEMRWVISRESGLIQLENLLPLEIIYQEEHGAGSVGKMWMDHHRAFAKFINESEPTSVFEIGGGHGILEKEYRAYKEIPWTILEPNPSPVEGVKAKYIKGYFDEKFQYDEHVDTVVHSHVLEHIYEPDSFMEQLSNFMKFGTRIIFSIPNMQVMMRKKYLNCLNFEHTYLLGEEYINYLLTKHGFELNKKEYFMDDHSIFYSAERKLKVKEIKLSEELYDRNKAVFLEFLNYYNKIIKDVNALIEKTNNPIYLFGGHIFSQYLIQFGLNTDKIECILDNDRNKQGRRIYGHRLKVKSPEILRDVDAPVVILKAGVYNDEIKNEILNKINKNTAFI